MTSVGFLVLIFCFYCFIHGVNSSIPETTHASRLALQRDRWTEVDFDELGVICTRSVICTRKKYQILGNDGQIRDIPLANVVNMIRFQ